MTLPLKRPHCFGILMYNKCHFLCGPDTAILLLKNEKTRKITVVFTESVGLCIPREINSVMHEV